MSAFGLFGGSKKAVSSANTKAKTAAAPAAPAGLSKTTPAGSRSSRNRTITGKAVPRTVGGETADAPEVNPAAAAQAANIAAQRVRRRLSGSVLSGLNSTTPAAGAKLQPRTLLGGRY